MYLREEDHVSRHVPYKKLLRDDNDDPIGILPQAFEMRDVDRKALSVNWLEFFGVEHAKNIVAMVQAFRKSRKAIGGGVGKNSAFGIGNVGKLQDTCADLDYAKVRVEYNEKKAQRNNKSHARIIRLPENESAIMQALASDVFVELIPNSDVP